MDDETNYTTGLAHLILCGTSGWAIKNTSFEDNPFALGAFTFLLGHGLLGLYKYTHPDVTSSVKNLYSKSLFLSKIVPLPVLNADILIMYKQPNEIVYLHPGSAILQTTIRCISSKYSNILTDLLVLGNLGTLGYRGYVNENYWAIGLTNLILMNHFILDLVADRYSVPKVDLYTIGLSFFNIFAVNCFR